VGGATVDSKTGVRHIKTLELYEYSPVLFGAMSAARTQSVKSLVDEMVHTIPEDEFKSWLSEFGIELKEDAKKKDPDDEEDPETGKPAESPEVEDSERITEEEDETPDDDDDAFDLEDDDEEDQNKHKSFPFTVTAYEREQLVATRDAIEAILQKADESFVLEDKADDGDGSDNEDAEAGTLAGAVEAQEDALGDLYDDILAAAEQFDSALDGDDTGAVDEAGDAVLSLVESGLEEAEGAQADALSAVAQAVADLAPEEDAPEDEDDTEKKGTKPLPPRPQSKEHDDGDVEVKSGVVIIEAKDIHDLKSKMLDGLLS
jgi:hypothetical protein